MSPDDRVGLEEAFNRYAEALDRKRWELLAEVFTADVRTTWPGGSEVSGLDAVSEFIAGFLGSEEVRTHHMLGNFTARIEGDRAEASVYSRSVHQGAGEREGILDESLGVFSATARRQDGGWRFDGFAQEVLVKIRTGTLFEGRA